MAATGNVRDQHGYVHTYTMLSQKCGRIDTHAEIPIIYDDMHKHCSLFWIHILYVNAKKKKGWTRKTQIRGLAFKRGYQGYIYDLYFLI